MLYFNLKVVFNRFPFSHTSLQNPEIDHLASLRFRCLYAFVVEMRSKVLLYALDIIYFGKCISVV